VGHAVVVRSRADIDLGGEDLNVAVLRLLVIELIVGAVRIDKVGCRIRGGYVYDDVRIVNGSSRAVCVRGLRYTVGQVLTAGNRGVKIEGVADISGECLLRVGSADGGVELEGVSV
jgi:hypothetical protein